MPPQFHAFCAIRIGRGSPQVDPDEIAEKVSQMKPVIAAHVVTGRFDVMAYIEYDKTEVLYDVLKNIRQIPGVRSTETLTTLTE